MTERRSFLRTFALACLLALDSVAHAQTTPRPARIIIGYPAGGTADLMARQLAEKLRGSYAPSTIVDNRVGALQAIPIQSLLSSDPDGSTLYFAPYSIVTLYPHVYRKLPYDPLTDLVPVSVVTSFEFALAVAPNTPAKNVNEFIAWAKTNPANANYGSLGLGTAFHFVGFMLSQAAGVTLTHVPYKGAAPVTQALLGGQIPSMIGPLGDLLPHHATGRARVLATSGPQRSVHTPDVPTFEEAGYRGLVAQERFGVFVRRGTPAPAVEAASKAIVAALQPADIRAAIQKLGYNEPRGSTPQEFEAMIKADYGRWQQVVKASGFTPDD